MEKREAKVPVKRKKLRDLMKGDGENISIGSELKIVVRDVIRMLSIQEEIFSIVEV